MKKNWISLLLCAALLMSLCACSQKDPLPRSVTAEEQLEETGIALYPPYLAENLEYWMVKSPTDGKAIPEVTFDFQGDSYHYRAEKTGKTEPYDFTGLKAEWTDEGSFGNDDRVGSAYTSENSAYLCWVEEGVAYLVFSETTNDMFTVFDVGHEIAYMDSWGGQIEDPDYVDDGEVTEWESTPVESMQGTWQFDGVGVFVRIDNFTYELFNPDCSPVDEVVRFWEPDPDDDHTIRLLNESGTLYMTLTIDDADWGEETVVNHAGEPAHRYDGAMDGTYRSQLSSFYLEGNALYLNDTDRFYITEETVQSMQAGDEISLSPDGFNNLSVERVEKLSDTEYRVSDWATVRYDNSRCAWQVLDESAFAYTSRGTAHLNESLQFEDVLDGGAHTDLASCLEAHDFVYADVTVKSGEVVSVLVDEAF